MPPHLMLSEGKRPFIKEKNIDSSSRTMETADHRNMAIKTVIPVVHYNVRRGDTDTTPCHENENLDF